MLPLELPHPNLEDSLNFMENSIMVLPFLGPVEYLPLRYGDGEIRKEKKSSALWDWDAPPLDHETHALVLQLLPEH